MHYLYWRNPDSALQTIIRDFSRLEYARAVNKVGWLTLDVEPSRFDTTLLKVNARIEPWRQVGARTPYLDGGTVFFLQSWEYWINGNGEERLTLHALDANFLLNSRIVAYAADSAEATQTDYADDMMKEIISHNLGSDATDTARSLATYLNVQAQFAGAPSTTKAFSHRNVLAVLQELANESYQAGTYLAFDIVYYNAVLLEFRTYTNQRGSDHGQTSSSPVIISRERKNLEEPSLLEDHEDESNYIYCGGQGEGSARMIETAYTADALYLNRREAWVDARQTSTSDGVAAEANAALFDRRYRKTLTGKIIDTSGTLYGVDYGYGDIVYAEYRGTGYDAHVDAIHVTVENGRETVDISIKGEAE